ncbi:unnamed protein product [Schistosoma curassoni]|uniref:Transposase n=1 Tax=Schistosoma curassoni TaxID=6186 RepID=A0A183JGM3_9TREM|nr:unnamed protein product [Schistosoma curassoni]
MLQAMSSLNIYVRNTMNFIKTRKKPLQKTNSLSRVYNRCVLNVINSRMNVIV